MRISSCTALLLLLLSSCAVSKNFNPATKYAPRQLQEDYTIFRNILEEEHPGLYWYTSKDSMDYYFEKGQNLLKDSLTETRFRYVLSYVISKIYCGHTSVRASKGFERMRDSLRARPFPLSLKVWKDTAVVMANLNRRDSAVNRGVVLTSIEGRPMQQIVDSLFQYLSADGYNLTHKYQTLSNRSTFGNLYMSVFGARPRYPVTYIDTAGQLKKATISLFTPARDTGARTRTIPPPAPRLSRRQQKKAVLAAARNLRLDTAARVAFMDLNSFTKETRLHSFFKRSFKKLHRHQMNHLVIDLRGNGGGSVTNSNLLTRYISQQPFKIADSLYAIKRKSRYGRYQQNRFLNWLFLLSMTKRKADGKFHFTYFEKKYYKPKKKYHYNGQVYILTGGNTFSASTLFIQSVMRQPNVLVVGEETGGGAYGNNAWLIPDVTLPNTKVRFRLPLFRLVIDRNATKGQGVLPEVPALPTVDAIRRNVDFKTEKVLEIIRNKTF